jgi:RND superfamily putative drug exporter
MQPPLGGHGRPVPAPTRFASTHPWAVLSVWLVVVALLGVAGLGIESRLSAGGLEVAGSESARARALIGGNFGDSATVPVLLRGPRADVKRQGKRLVQRLAKRPGVRVLSPWSASSGRSALRPSRDRALLLLTVSGTRADIERRSASVQRLVDKTTSAPVRASVTGMPLLTSEGTHRSLTAIHRAELIALPLLFIALLLVFQSFAAAAIPAAFGAAMIASSTGALALLARAIHLDAFALAISCMVGLALAVDYSLLMVSRTREELAERGDVAEAVGRAAMPPRRSSWRWPSRQRSPPAPGSSPRRSASASWRCSRRAPRSSSSPRCSSSPGRTSATAPMREPRAASAQALRVWPPAGRSSASSQPSSCCSLASRCWA